MKVLFFLFVAANVALYVWATQATPKAESGLPQPRVGHNLSRMTLDSEQFGEASKPTNCLRIGPFSTQQTLVDGRRMLVNRGYGLAQQRTTAREVHSHRFWRAPFCPTSLAITRGSSLKTAIFPQRISPVATKNFFFYESSRPKSRLRITKQRSMLSGWRR